MCFLRFPLFSLLFSSISLPKLKKIQTLAKIYQFLIELPGCKSMFLSFSCFFWCFLFGGNGLVFLTPCVSAITAKATGHERGCSFFSFCLLVFLVYRTLYTVFIVLSLPKPWPKPWPRTGGEGYSCCFFLVPSLTRRTRKNKETSKKNIENHYCSLGFPRVSYVFVVFLSFS